MKIWKEFLNLTLSGKIIISIFFFGIIGIIFNAGTSSQTTPQQTAQVEKAPQPVAEAPKPKPELDIMTESSCEDWLVIIGEGAKGLKTEAEVREGMQQVYEIARYSTDAEIVEYATQQLAAITAGDFEAFGVASEAFGNACKARGAL
jgi:hypothetical protein